MPASELAERAAAFRSLPPPDLRRAIRTAAGVSQADLGASIGVTAQAIAHWEKGERTPRAVHLVSYVRALRDLQGADQTAVAS